MKEKKNAGLALAISIKDGKVESKLKAKGLSQFEVIGLLVFQILNVCAGLKQKN